MESFPEEGLLPTTITHLKIWRFSKLSGLDKNGLTQLTSLQRLQVWGCLELETLSEEGFPTSLTSLEISNCPLVSEKYSQKESGNEEYWNKISHIPNSVFIMSETYDEVAHLNEQIAQETLSFTLKFIRRYSWEGVDEFFFTDFGFCFHLYVSDKFDSTVVTKTLLQELAPGDANEMNLNSLQVNLSNKLMGKKFLIVLDDVWEDDYAQWAEVMKPFNGGAKGSKIIVTTRNGKVADIIRTVDTHQLRELSEDECWVLFMKHASSGNYRKFTENPHLERIGKEISKKCNGLPLAAKVLGGILRSTLDAERWKHIAMNNLWELTHERSKTVPAALEVSYYFVPLHLKGCFAFCSIFPKGYPIQREELVLLWMAENLVMRSKGNRRMEEVGGEYFDDLVSMSFFVKSMDWRGISCFVMHDLLVDLAKIVSGKYKSLLENNEDIVKFEKKTRHLGCVMELYTDNKIASYDFGATRLRTFLTLLDSSYSNINISKEEVQNLLSMLKCLRVLSFRGVHMTVKLEDCNHLQTLPKEMHHLINLRHLIINGDSLVEMPSQIGKLTNLQILTTFVLGKDSGAKVEELAELHSLHGELSIKKLENVVNITKALDQVIVLEKKQLEKLRLEWSVNDVNVDLKHGEGVLEMLSPNRTLKELEIIYYPGKIFPNWVGNDSFSNIGEVTLYGCKHCSYLPPFGQLPLLKYLSISRCNSVVTVGAEFYGNCSVRKPFSLLETLRFSHMSSWEQWHSMQTEEATTYGKLETLEINSCPKFEGDLPRFLPSLISIESTGNKECPLLSLPRLPCVTNMSIDNLENSESLYEAIKPRNHCSTLTPLYHYPPLQELHLESCGSSFRSLHLDLFPNLKTLHIESSNYFEAISVSDGKSLEELTSLSIKDCGSFVSFPNVLIAPKLSEFIIRDCSKLKWLPEQMTSLSSLESLTISKCPLIGTLPEDGLPVNLSILHISYDELLRMKWNWKTLPHLTTLSINGYGIEEDVESFPEEGLLPTTITEL
ncbi:putative disease resistance protein At3g14460 [Cannabis sativa]|uniref:putative disease resistance protein At3g14460 n=1 Tax=Cannabis sativa TaxID=3483 RepID=UPI0029CA2203|nr:putative disease resistance protein At3g14460 [Cannabis sativa]